MPKHFLLFILIGLTITFSHAQTDSVSVIYDNSEIVRKEISPADLESYKNNPDFDYEVVKQDAPTWWVSFKNWMSNLVMRFFEWLFGIEKASGAFNTFLEILPYLLLVALLFILIKFFININTNSVISKSNTPLVSLSEEEHIIKNTDIEQLIKQALANNDYRLAIRYYYLYILQLMTEKDIIKWELQKTNEDYLKEIQEAGLKENFNTITRHYNYIWYGDFPIDHTKYNKAEASFLALKKIIANA
ncbi:DUF4129 domain-containing protein [Maribacter sp. MMG018]|uniref:DUF4129 domain-containing protein n=1 Tax=Maribacter sp. MMG018 TaxID=2822688 RepID=UPI001B35DA75|nr:DUF4129 domain-containing protein [Maribacter sp. MMG018]MBQ4914486.1 DUF4129 domain-containing protein [Maribacter sp. MMG018]